jgi:hypothetical protein
MKQNYINRAMKARDPRFGKIAGKLGYGTRAMQAAPVDDIVAVRDEYEAAIGKRAYHGWDIPTLREKIAAAKAAD